MHRLKGLVTVLAVAGLVAGLSARSFAGPLLPPLPTTPGSPAVAGESKLAEVATAGDFIRIDWIVQDAAPFGFPGFFAYLYQIENTTGTGEGIRSFNVAFNTGQTITAGVLGGDDLDVNTGYHFGHNNSNFANLGAPPPPPETEPSPGTPNPSSAGAYNVFISPTGVSWNINVGHIPPGYESITLYIIDPRPPMYGPGVAQNSFKQWRTGPTFIAGQFGDPVPVPSPEPATLALLFLGMGLIGFMRRRSR